MAEETEDIARNEIYLDKIKLGWALVEKELDLIHQHTILISDIKRRYIDIDRLVEYDTYCFAWANLIELYTVLRDTYKSALSKEELEKLDKIVLSFENINDNRPKLEELSIAYKLVLKIMGKTGFHQLIRNSDMTKGLDKISKRYKLGKHKNE